MLEKKDKVYMYIFCLNSRSSIVECQLSSVPEYKINSMMPNMKKKIQ